MRHWSIYGNNTSGNSRTSNACMYQRVQSSVKQSQMVWTLENLTALAGIVTHLHVACRRISRSAHIDDSGICESVMFINRQGRPPKGTRHEWAFAVAGHILILPETKDECALVYLRGNGLWHGTLPTSYRHVNAGSALVTKALTIDTMRRHGQGCSHGPSWRM